MSQAPDKIETLDDASLIQHGPFNARIYLMKTSADLSPHCPRQLIVMAGEKGYSKIFAKVPESKAGSFLEAGFIEEARIPAFFSESEAALFMAFYTDPRRAVESDAEKLEENLRIAFEKAKTGVHSPLDKKFLVRACREEDAKAMAEIYREVFASYPFPIRDSEYLAKTIKANIDYFGIESDGVLIALSSTETDAGSSSCEMTDFATLPSWRGNSFGAHLLEMMEGAMKEKKIKTLYTIARSLSPGINITFARAGYRFAGRLKNNTNISGRIESMNVWYKSLRR